jgi:hypothetical protein
MQKKLDYQMERDIIKLKAGFSSEEDEGPVMECTARCMVIITIVN